MKRLGKKTQTNLKWNCDEANRFFLKITHERHIHTHPDTHTHANIYTNTFHFGHISYYNMRRIFDVLSNLCISSNFHMGESCISRHFRFSFVCRCFPPPLLHIQLIFVFLFNYYFLSLDLNTFAHFCFSIYSFNYAYFFSLFCFVSLFFSNYIHIFFFYSFFLSLSLSCALFFTMIKSR